MKHPLQMLVAGDTVQAGNVALAGARATAVPVPGESCSWAELLVAAATFLLHSRDQGAGLQNAKTGGTPAIQLCNHCI